MAERQFNRIDPDNRLVPGELERRWEAALSEVRTAVEALARQASAEPVAQLALSKVLNSKVIVLSGCLPLIWAGDATTAHRKALLRCLIEKIVLDRGERGVALVRIVWRSGAVTELEVKMKVNSVAKLTRGLEIARA